MFRPYGWAKLYVKIHCTKHQDGYNFEDFIDLLDTKEVAFYDYIQQWALPTIVKATCLLRSVLGLNIL